MAEFGGLLHESFYVLPMLCHKGPFLENVWFTKNSTKMAEKKNHLCSALNLKRLKYSANHFSLGFNLSADCK